MAYEQIEQFLAALQKDPQLIEKFQSGISGLDSVVEFAREMGFDISFDDAREFIREQANVELSDEQLEAIAGGKGGGGGGSTAVATVSVVAAEAAAVQSVAAATTEAVAAETTEAVVAETTEAVAAETSVAAVVEVAVVPILIS